MSDVTYSKLATERRTVQGLVPGKGDANSVKVLVAATIELAAATASGTTIKLGRIPSNARILSEGLLHNDDLATSGSPTLDIGIGSVDSNLTGSATAISNGQALSAATTTTMMLTDPASVGKYAWQLAGASSDPGGLVDVYATVKDAATTALGSIVVVLKGYFD